VKLEQEAPGQTHIQANRQTVIFSEKTLASIAIVAAGVAGTLAYWAERETRMLEYYLLELDAKFIHAGLKPPEEAIAVRLSKGDINMSGGSGGGIIIINAANITEVLKQTLVSPLVHSKLTPVQLKALDPILKKDSNSWTTQEIQTANDVFLWAAETFK
jgi:predicted ribosomally synthesized peptide with SipW-like signal peptide